MRSGTRQPTPSERRIPGQARPSRKVWSTAISPQPTPPAANARGLFGLLRVGLLLDFVPVVRRGPRNLAAAAFSGLGEVGVRFVKVLYQLQRQLPLGCVVPLGPLQSDLCVRPRRIRHGPSGIL